MSLHRLPVPTAATQKVHPYRTGGGTDLAFAVMVLAAYFTTFSTISSISAGRLILIIVLGIAYIAIGVYGYALCARGISLGLVLIYFLVQIVLGELIIILSGAIGFNAMILLPLAGHSVVLLPEASRYATNGVIVLLYAWTLRWMSGGWDVVWTNLPIFIAGQVFILVFTQMAVSEEQARHEIQGLVKDLENANQQLRQYALQAEDLAVTKERNRMAREIHDGIGHHLTALNMQVKAAKAVLLLNTRKANELLSNAEAITQQALLDVRHSVAALREGVGEDVTLPEQIETAIRICGPSGIEANFQILGNPRSLTPETKLALFRATQECVNNMIKHSGAKHAKIELDFSSESVVRFLFRDDGRGAEGSGGGFGLIGMKERVVLLDGSMDVQTGIGEGFGVEIVLPG